MNKFLVSLATVGLCASLVSAKQPSTRTNYSGRWVLNVTQTKHLPTGLKAYSMVVSQNAQQLEVRTNLEGKLTPPTRDISQPIPEEEELPGVLLPNGLTLQPLQPGDAGSGTGGPPWEYAPVIPGSKGSCTEALRNGAFASFTLYPPRVIYTLDRREWSSEFGAPRHAPATSKAHWGNWGNVLRLSLTGKDALSRTCGMWHWTELQDRWKLSKDGQELVVDRTVSTLAGPHRLRLIFSKQSATSGERQN